MNSLIKQFLQSSHISGGNAAFVELLYERYLVDPTSVDGAWKAYFDQLGGREHGDEPPAGTAVPGSARRRALGRRTATEGMHHEPREVGEGT